MAQPISTYLKSMKICVQSHRTHIKSQAQQNHLESQNCLLGAEAGGFLGAHRPAGVKFQANEIPCLKQKVEGIWEETYPRLSSGLSVCVVWGSTHTHRCAHRHTYRKESKEGTQGARIICSKMLKCQQSFSCPHTFLSFCELETQHSQVQPSPHPTFPQPVQQWKHLEPWDFPSLSSFLILRNTIHALGDWTPTNIKLYYIKQTVFKNNV